MKRNPNGTYAKGTSGNPSGAPKSRKDYQAMLQTTCTPAKWEAICVKAIAQAAEGDRAARIWVGNYLMGKAVQRIKADIATRSVIDARYTNILDRVYGDAANGSEDELSQDPD